MIIPAIIMVLSLYMFLWGTKLSLWLKKTSDDNSINQEIAATTIIFFIIFLVSLFYTIKHIL
jgi:hypothetical protein